MTLASATPRGEFATGGLMRSAGFVGLGAIGIAVGLSDVLARAPANAFDVGPPLTPPSAQFLFGTDLLGRDMASETLHALAITATSAGLGTLVTIVFGVFFAFVAVRLPLALGPILRAVAGTLCSVPALFLAILVIGLAERSFAPIAAGLAATPFAFARAYDRARALNRSQHAEVARATGISAMALIRRDLIYEFRDMFVLNVLRALADVVVILSTVSFFGFGAVPPHRDLGLMIGAARETFFDAWWTAAFPALALVMLILCARLVSTMEEGRAS